MREREGEGQLKGRERDMRERKEKGKEGTKRGRKGGMVC